MDLHLRAHERVISMLDKGVAGPAFEEAKARVKETWTSFTTHVVSHSAQTAGVKLGRFAIGNLPL